MQLTLHRSRFDIVVDFSLIRVAVCVTDTKLTRRRRIALKSELAVAELEGGRRNTVVGPSPRGMAPAGTEMEASYRGRAQRAYG